MNIFISMPLTMYYPTDEDFLYMYDVIRALSLKEENVVWAKDVKIKDEDKERDFLFIENNYFRPEIAKADRILCLTEARTGDISSGVRFERDLAYKLGKEVYIITYLDPYEEDELITIRRYLGGN